MKREANGPTLSAVFVDYDNIYLSLRRKSEEAAKRFAKDAGLWLREIESGRLITPTNSPNASITRRMVMNRCYGNPVPRRNAGDNSTDMNSFPFIRHNFLRAGFEIIDCPPLTAQLKNSSDIRMVMDIRDLLGHDTYYDEFIILSGDADFTPVLHRLRAHARRTVIFANDHTAVPYTAICDGEVRESDLINLLLDGRIADDAGQQMQSLPRGHNHEQLRHDIMSDVVQNVRRSGQPMPLETLAERATRNLGHERTIGSDWAGHGSFRELLMKALPQDLKLTDEPPYLVMPANMPANVAPPRTRELLARDNGSRELLQRDANRDGGGREPAHREQPQREPQARETQTSAGADAVQQPALRARLASGSVFQGQQGGIASRATGGQAPAVSNRASAADAPMTQGGREPFRSRSTPGDVARTAGRQEALVERPALASPQQPPSAPPPALPPAPAAPPPPAVPDRQAAETAALQQSIARIHDACQAPPLAPPEYRALFDVMAGEISENGLQGTQTLANIQIRAQNQNLKLQRDDIRFVLDVVGESDPWFEQGASSTLFAGRFRNFVVARCRTQGLALSAEELDLIEAWFAGGPPPGPSSGSRVPRPAPNPDQQQPVRASVEPPRGGNWWAGEPQPQAQAGYAPARAGSNGEPPALAGQGADDEFPRIVRRGRV